MRIEALEAADWPRVAAIYGEGIAGGLATFETELPSWQEWDAAHLGYCRLVARRGDEVLGWAALSPASRRSCYAGVAEASVYVAADARRQGVGRALLEALIRESEAHGIWTLQAATLAENAASLRLQAECGFRVIGRRERIAMLKGVWRDTVLTERRSRTVGRAGEQGAPLGDADLGHLRRAIDLAWTARRRGNHPFGALLVSAEGALLAEAENSVVTGRDSTAHAELSLVRLASGRYNRNALAGSTLFSSTEPCVMCAGAIVWSGIGRVVYALPEERLYRLTGHGPAGKPLDLPCREVFVRHARRIEVAGPALEEEAEEVHRGFWGPGV
jgi:L-amino acid N-acyltransferase YncA/tRNA(Arg) A34 adenosine deaminase TadA